MIHETAVVGPLARVGAGARIWHFSHVMDGARIGVDTVIGQNGFVAGAAIIGHRVKIQNNVSIFDGVIIEDDVFIGPSVVFTNVAAPRAHTSRRGRFEKTRVSRGATIGANATIVCGNHIGAHAFVGAGAVVTRAVADHALVVGNPAAQIGWVCRCGERLDDTLRCPACGEAYTERGGAIASRPGQ